MRRCGGGVGILVSALFLLPLPGTLWGQDQTGAQPPDQTVTVYLDCQYHVGCDSSFFRTEVNWVNWVLNREDAEVHVLVTGQGTGGGGSQINLDFLGLRAFEGDDVRLSHASSGDATQDDVRQALVEILKRGFMRYLVGRPIGDRMVVTHRPSGGPPGAPPGGPGGAPPGTGVDVDEPGDSGVMTVSLSGGMSGEDIVSSTRANGSLRARRFTEDWKVDLDVSGSHSRTDYELDGGTESSIRKSWNLSGLVARSISEHWTVGTNMSGGGNTYSNQQLRLRMAPGIEYNVFPYSESTRRELLFLYSLGVTHWNYEAITIFDQEEETRLDQSVTAQLNLQQPWGSMVIFSEAAHYFHDTSLWRAEIGGFMNIRLFKGFRFNVSGSYAWIRDQLDLEAGEVSEVDILTRRRQLATSFRASTNFGVSYTFGSIFNNVVNPRFGGRGGSFFFF